MATRSATTPGGLVELDPEDGRWLRFVEDAPDATPFHLPAWLRALSATYGYRSLVAAQLDEAGGVLAGLPLVRVVRPLSGSVYVSLPFTDHVRPLARDEQGAIGLASALESWRRTEGHAGVAVRGRLPAMESVHTVEAGVRHLLELQPGANELLRLKPSVARHVKAAERAGVHVRLSRSARDLSSFYRLHLETRRRLGVPVQPRRFLQAIWTDLIEPGFGFVAMAEGPGDEPLAAALFLVHKRTVVYKYGASDASHWHLKPNHLLFREVIRWGCENGIEVLDFGRSDLTSQGLRQFKSSWGAVEVPLVYASLGSAGGAPKGGGRLASAMSAVIRRSPAVVCRAVGELLYRYAA
jgi:CelD/BcsL family acetyltransferase involved in cellulose biosynthesis